MRAKTLFSFLFLLLLFLGLAPAAAQDDIRALREEIRRMREQGEKQQQQIRALEEKLQRMEAQSAQRAKELERKVAEQTSSWVDRYLRTRGDSRLHLTGYAFADYRWRSKHGNQGERINTFGAGFNPIFHYRLNDWIFFEGELELELEGDETEVALENAQANVFLNDYMTLAAGLYFTPFGEFIERIHPAWIHKLITRPLPYRRPNQGGFLRFSEVGVQLRGVVPLSNLQGREVEYAVYVGNGPRFESEERGSHLENNFEDNNFGKVWGGRIGFRPLPFQWEWGRLKVGASTYNGKWNSDLWLNIWGLDWAYQKEPFELRGEYLGFRREMPSGVNTDKRGGWYLQAAYKLTAVPIRLIDRSEIVLRYSALHQAGNPDRDFVPKPRQFAVGWDFWLTPSVVWKLEYDRDFPRGDKKGNQFMTQFALGF